MSQREQLLARLRTVLVCPACRSGLTEGRGGELHCGSCGLTVARNDGAFLFQGLTEDEQQKDWLNAIKAAAKHRLGRLYPIATDVLAPVNIDRASKDFVNTFSPDQLVCDLGSGTNTLAKHVVCVDGYPYKNVHVVCDLAALPFADNSIDGVVSHAVLEHVPDPAAHVAEMFRVLRPGGRVHSYVPFMQPFHASPHDYSRLTIPGLQHLFRAFVDFDARVSGGPTSGLLWTLQEWIAIAGSFGSERLYRAIVPLTWVLSPLKFLDNVLIKHPSAHVIASGFAITATKPASQA